jgi:hypothetical protein
MERTKVDQSGADFRGIRTMSLNSQNLRHTIKIFVIFCCGFPFITAPILLLGIDLTKHPNTYLEDINVSSGT